MRVDRVAPSLHKKGRVLLFLEDGSLLKITEQELLDFGLRPGDDLDEDTLSRLKTAAGASDVKGQAAAMIGKRAMSRADLEKKLREKGASADDARYAAEWLEAIGAINDAEYAASLVRHYSEMGYGPARYQEELRKHGIPRDLWEDAMAEAPDAVEVAERVLQNRFRGGISGEADRRRAANALARRGFDWGTVLLSLKRESNQREF